MRAKKKLPAIYFEYDKEQTEQLKSYFDGLIDEHRITGNRPNPSFLSTSIKEFVNHGADPNVESSISTAPLHFAAEAGDVDLIKFLARDFGANIDGVSQADHTPLWFAARYGHVEAAIELLRLGARISDDFVARVRAKDGVATLFTTYFSNEATLFDEKILHNQIRLGCHNPCLINPVTCMIRYSQTDQLEPLINLLDSFGQTPIDIAIINDKPEFINLLLDRGANPLLSKYSIFRAKQFCYYKLGDPREYQMTLDEKIYQSAARHYLNILAKNPSEMHVPKDLMLSIIYIAFRDNLFPIGHKKRKR
jgi:ankyrin repeat protein